MTIDLKPIAIFLRLVSKLLRAGAVKSASDFCCLVDREIPRSLPRLILFAPSIIVVENYDDFSSKIELRKS